MEYIVQFNKIFNGKGAIGREAQTVTNMLTSDHFHLNTTLEDYGIEDMTSENDSEVERHSTARKTKGPQFTIPPGYVLPESTTTTTSVSLNDINAGVTPTRQPRSRTRSRSGYVSSRKGVMAIESDDDMENELVSKRK